MRTGAAQGTNGKTRVFRQRRPAACRSSNRKAVFVRLPAWRSRMIVAPDPPEGPSGKTALLIALTLTAVAAAYVLIHMD